jgi:hypothetical protein
MEPSPVAGDGMIASLLLTLCVGAAPLLQSPPPHVLILTGLGGEPKYRQEFTAQARSIITGLQRFRIPSERITWLAEAEEAGAAGRATKQRVEQELQRISGAAAPGDRVILIFIGHGSQQQEPQLNLPGPDLTAGELARMLEGLGDRPVAMVIAASASGGFVDRLAGPGRLVITATKSGTERNESRFGHWLAEAFAKGAADTDKDGAMSLLEAFTFAATEVRREYESTNRLLTEHARVSDSTLARRFTFTTEAGASAPADPAVRALQERKQALEAQIAALRERKSRMDSTAYERELETLLRELAGVNQELRRKQP